MPRATATDAWASHNALPGNEMEVRAGAGHGPARRPDRERRELLLYNRTGQM